MCINYKPSSREEILALMDLGEVVPMDWPEEVWQDYAAPIIRSDRRGTNELLVATYGMVPKSHLPPAAKRFTTMNARAETIGQKPSYAKAWRQGQTCLIPTACFYEPNYESGKAERWAIGSADDAPFCVAGLWRQWEEEEGGQAFSFTQITINADTDPLMRRFHKPDDEKRSLVVVPREDYSAWLNCRDPELARSLLRLYPAGQLKAWHAPRGGHQSVQGSLL
ncbi:putative SOS response-associated peptidase YedK [Herbaspirillum sp. Sphag1AN]|uniref:SOS response-associated peptidase n=1 Tax=unclassified Herbaspirillum TaxID=2624150 RepID=UPI001609477C|nr:MULTISPECIES: SOS response-associated peptidase family protein [unclassified Herbaspirillum]MBB3211768.1 putative SOS response-associated peptidase YedK [Herbaspirillum sp. Sphag1AN]MBB3244964.1 putative SOS response-associated peptidase YedK [Herbaspirillum sp. Sphag64]